MTLVCAECRTEGRPALLGEIDTISHPSVAYGLCWTHRLRRLAPEKVPDTPSMTPRTFPDR
jgi:hypothetical protein